MNQLPLPIPRIRATRAPLVVLTRCAIDGVRSGYRVLNRDVFIQREMSERGRVVGFTAFDDVYVLAEAPLLRDVRMALARLYPELPRERRKRAKR